MTQIKIEEISQTETQYGTKITFVSGKNKYSFYSTRRDGSETKAYQQFKKYGFTTGTLVNCEVKEEQKSFKNEFGKEINYTQRTILYFEEVENVPTHRKAPESPAEANSTPLKALEDRVEALENVVYGQNTAG